MSSTTMKSIPLVESRRDDGTSTAAVPCSAAKAGNPATPRRKAKTVGISYKRSKGVADYVRAVAGATPIEIIAIERQGMPGTFINDLSKRMGLPISRMFDILGVPNATVRKKVAAGENLDGCAGQSAVRIVKLLGIAQNIVSNSTAVEAKNFDSIQWLGQWIERPQLALGGQKPADLIDTPTGGWIVERLLGSLESGAYQ